MAVRLVHRHQWPHEVRFGDRAAAVAYADRYGGGLARWDVVVASAHTAGPDWTGVARRAPTLDSGR